MRDSDLKGQPAKQGERGALAPCIFAWSTFKPPARWVIFPNVVLEPRPDTQRIIVRDETDPPRV